MFKLIKGELFLVEHDKGEYPIRENICNYLGHDIAEQDHEDSTITIQKGLCKRCGFGERHWKLSKKETKQHLA